jgi:hypothetical protein
MMAIGHFFTGYTATLIGTMLAGEARPSWAVLGGLFAMLPDAYKADPELIPERIREKLQAFHDSPLANICFGHQWIDKWDKEDSPRNAAIPIGAGTLATIASKRWK